MKDVGKDLYTSCFYGILSVILTLFWGENTGEFQGGKYFFFKKYERNVAGKSLKSLKLYFFSMFLFHNILEGFHNVKTIFYPF